MELENQPVQGAPQAAPATEEKGDFGWKSSTPAAPAEENNQGSEATPATPAAPESPSAPETPPATPENENQEPAADDEVWFNIPSKEGNTESGTPAAAAEGAPDDNEPETPAPVEKDWREIIKGVSREDLLKELGIEEDDDFERDFKKFRRSGGDPLQYLEAKSRDWAKVPDADLAMQALANEYPGLEKNELQKLFDNRYMQTDLDTDEDKEIGALKLKSAASKQRAALIEQQKQFTIPDKQTPAVNEEEVVEKYRQSFIQQAEETVKADNEAYLNEPTTKSILESKKVAVPMGDGKSFYIGVDPAEIVGYFTDPEVYSRIQFGENGKPDWQTEQAIAAIRTLGLANYNKQLISVAEGRVRKALIEEGQNAGKTGGATPPPATKQPTQWRST